MKRKQRIKHVDIERKKKMSQQKKKRIKKDELQQRIQKAVK